MKVSEETLEIPIDGRSVQGTFVQPDVARPGVLFVHGWGGDRAAYVARAREIATLGYVCLAFDLRGHARDAAHNGLVTREDNLRDVIAAYDTLAAHRAVDAARISVVGSSYGGYLAAILSAERPVQRLALRVPALYKDEDWLTPKRQLNRDELDVYRRGAVRPEESRALRACSAFRGDVLVVESEHDQTIPHPVIENYRNAFAAARSLTYRMMHGADHGLSEPRWQADYTRLLAAWLGEMLSHELAGALAGAAPAARMPQPA